MPLESFEIETIGSPISSFLGIKVSKVDDEDMLEPIAASK